MTKEGELGKRQDERLRPEKSRKKGRFQGLPSAALRLPLSLLPDCRALSPLAFQCSPSVSFPLSGCLGYPLQQLCLGKNKSKTQNNSWGKTTAAASSPSAAPATAVAGKAGTQPALGRALISNPIAASCQPLHTHRKQLGPIYHRGEGVMEGIKEGFTSVSWNERLVQVSLSLPGSVPAPRHLPTEKSPATAGLQLYCPQYSSAYRFRPPDSSSGKN